MVPFRLQYRLSADDHTPPYKPSISFIAKDNEEALKIALTKLRQVVSHLKKSHLGAVALYREDLHPIPVDTALWRPRLRFETRARIRKVKPSTFWVQGYGPDALAKIAA